MGSNNQQLKACGTSYWPCDPPFDLTVGLKTDDREVRSPMPELNYLELTFGVRVPSPPNDVVSVEEKRT